MPTLIAILLPLIAPAARALIQHAEQAFQSKPKSGPDKLSTVVEALTGFATGLAKAGVISALPNPTELGTIAQTVFDQLKAANKLNGSGAQPDQGSNTLISVQGWKVVGQL